MASDRLQVALIALREAVARTQLPLSLPGAETQRHAVREVTAQLDDYILPRLATIDAPLLAVVGGSTGAGKSTLVNSLVGRVVTRPGVIRPTTKAPVLVHHSRDRIWFENERILPSLSRTLANSNDQRELQLVTEDTIPPGLAILDAPDVDSVDEENRRLAAQLLAAADLWLFVTSAARYADAVPWEFLINAADRSAAVAVVLDRVPPAAMGEIPAHLGQMMTERGLGSSPLFAVPETTVDADGLLPDAAVSPIRTWLATLAADVASRQQVVHQTLDGAIGALTGRTPALVDAVQDQQSALAQLRRDADKSFAEAVRTVTVQTADGTLLRGEVLTRWHDFIGTGEIFRALEQKIGWLRDRIVNVLRGQPKGAEKVQMAVESGLEALLREEGEAAAERAEAAWRANPAGRELLDRARDDMSRASRDYAADAARTIRDWQGAVLDLVADEGMEKRSRARFLAFGVNTVGLALMIVVFAYTGGLTGAEVGVAGGTAALAQRVLEGVFGEDAVRRLAQRAKADLDDRVEALMAVELQRYHALLDSVGTDPERADLIREATTAVEAARREDGLPGSARAAREASPHALDRGRERVDLSIAADDLAEDAGHALVGGRTPASLEPRRAATDVYELEAGRVDDIVDAEIVQAEPRRGSVADRREEEH